MIPYQHFAVPNLFLVNGYEEIHTQDGIVREYTQEDELEHCVRRLLLRNPRALRGWDLRFLRNGLDLSQADFGQMVDRDAQTIARWEKSSEPVPKFADVMIRIRFAERFEPALGIRDVMSFCDGSAHPLPNLILFKLGEYGWSFDLEPSIKLATIKAHARTVAELSSAHGPTFKVYEGQGSTRASLFRQDEDPAFVAIGSLIVPSSQIQDDLLSIHSSSSSTASLPREGNFNELPRNYVH
jgi:DNA-binding transcriptional regulator YiaG